MTLLNHHDADEQRHELPVTVMQRLNAPADTCCGVGLGVEDLVAFVNLLESNQAGSSSLL